MPAIIKARLGYQLDLVQQGLPPTSGKPMKTVGPGCRELTAGTGNNEFRLFYLVTGHRVYVLHAFAKKDERTTGKDKNLARQRYATAVNHAKQK